MRKPKKHHPKGKGCWYKLYIRECALCGAGDASKRRRWDPKPPPEKRIDYEVFVCDEHFM
jgi:hypothetical protein